MEAKRLERLRLAELSRRREIAKQRVMSDFDDKSESEHSYVDIQFKGRLIEQIEDGIYNIKRRGSGASDYSLESLDELGDPRSDDQPKSDLGEQLLLQKSGSKVSDSKLELKRPGSAQPVAPLLL